MPEDVLELFSAGNAQEILEGGIALTGPTFMLEGVFFECFPY